MSRTIQKLLPLLLLASAFAIRFWASWYARFTGDESHQWFVARQIATFATFPAYGLQITGSDARLPGGLCYWLIAIPQLFGSSPRLGSIGVALGHVFALAILYALLLRARGPRAALIGLAFGAVAPWEVLYSDRIWGSSLMPVLGSLCLYAAVRAKDGARWQATLIAVSAMLPQLHLSAPIAWLACGVIVWHSPPERWSKKAIAIGLGIALLAYAPPLIAEIRSGFENTRLIFGRAGGDEPWSKVALVPIQMAVYAIFYGSAELSYHFDRGYWGGYDDIARYATWSGWQRWIDRDGSALTLLTIVSILLSAILWGRALLTAAKAIAVAIRTRRKAAISSDHAVLLALCAGMLGGIALMVPARKIFFPHYANVLMPLLLWPVATSLDAWCTTKLRSVWIAIAGASLIAMMINVVRYYRQIDGLDGLGPTTEMVGAALERDRPIDVQFEHFNNAFAWGLLAKGHFGRDLKIQRGALERWRVKNARRFEGYVPTDSTRYGPTVVIREEQRRARAPDLIYRASEHWRTIEIHGKTSCKAITGPACDYGDRPWQHFGPDSLEMRGRWEPILFLHPIAGRTVTARMEIPTEATRGVLSYGLSDAAHQSDNTAPIVVRLRQADTTLLDFPTEPLRGLKSRPFTLTSTQTLELEITTTNDGARVFGFDLDLMK